MAGYNMRKRADRDRMLRDLRSELEAIEVGTWPRDINDDMRWGAHRTFRDAEHKRAYARLMVEAEIRFLVHCAARIAAGTLDWEA